MTDPEIKVLVVIKMPTEKNVDLHMQILSNHLHLYGNTQHPTNSTIAPIIPESNNVTYGP